MYAGGCRFGLAAFIRSAAISPSFCAGCGRSSGCGSVSSGIRCLEQGTRASRRAAALMPFCPRTGAGSQSSFSCRRFSGVMANMGAAILPEKGRCFCSVFLSRGIAVQRLIRGCLFRAGAGSVSFMGRFSAMAASPAGSSGAGRFGFFSGSRELCGCAAEIWFSSATGGGARLANASSSSLAGLAAGCS